MIKKISSIVLISSFVLGLVAFAPVMAEENAGIIKSVENNGVKANAGEKLEKIPSPDQIRFYKNIVKKDSALFGILKVKMIEKKEMIASSSEQKLEKITAPQYLGLYEKIRKIGTAMWGFMKKDAKKEVKKRIVTAEMSSCVISAIEVKDAALVSSNTLLTTNLNTAITARTACQKTALGSTEKQLANLDACTKTFKEADRTLRDGAKKEHDSIWKTYKESLTTCSKNTPVGTSSPETQSEVVIEDGGGSVIAQ